MALKPYLLGPFQTGFQNNVEPWLLPEDAFEELEDAYVWRGRVLKRPGSTLIGQNAAASRLRLSVGTTDGSGNISVTVPGTVFKIGQNFSIADEWFTVLATGTPANMLTTGAATTATYNTTNGTLVINGSAANTAVFFYPAEPVMGLRQRELATVNAEDVVAFDTQFAYVRSSGAWINLANAFPPPAAATWTGDDADFFWTWNGRGASLYDRVLWVVNGVDNLRYIAQGSTTWVNLVPVSRGIDTVTSAKIVIQFKDRIVLFNTTENDGSTRLFPNRARWSQNGDPTVAATSWLDDVPGRGGYIDAPTSQAIVTVELLKDRCIVYFEQSTWELVYTGNQILPFIWQQINSELGVESTFSIIGFDRDAIGVGNSGVHQCDGANVSRIDQKIPDEVWEIHNGNDGPQRVYGIRDYFREVIYWTFPNQTENPTYPNRILYYDYVNPSWAIFNDTFTCFGYFQPADDVLWQDVLTTWEETFFLWNSARLQSRFQNIIAGNQQGWVLYLEPQVTSNAQSLSITDMTAGNQQLVIVDHNLVSGNYVLVEGAQGISDANGTIYQVLTVVDADTIVLKDSAFTGTYTGDGKLRRVSGFNLLTKRFNPGTPVGTQFSIPYVDFYVDKTDDGQFKVDILVAGSPDSIQGDPANAAAFLGTSIVSTTPGTALLGADVDVDSIWQRYFVNIDESTIQLRMFLDEDQITNSLIAWSDFTLQALLVYAEATGRITG